jgi:hypothetical protein
MIADRDGGQPVLLSACLESNNTLFLNLYLCGVLYQDDALKVGDEVPQLIRKSGLPT